MMKHALLTLCLASACSNATGTPAPQATVTPMTNPDLDLAWSLAKSADGKRLLVMSAAAHQSLTPAQIAQLEKHSQILSSSLDTIEACGGGSARCMMAEIFLPRI